MTNGRSHHLSARLRSVVAGALLLGASPPAQAPAPRIPLIKGLTVTHAVSTPEGDYESTATIGAVSSTGMMVTVSGDVPNSQSKRPETVSVDRMVRTVDLAEARIYKTWFNSMDDAVIPGTTAMGLSTREINDIRAKGQVTLTLDGSRGGLASMVGGLLGALGDSKAAKSAKAALGAGPAASGTLKLVELKPVALSILVNGARAQLGAWHLRGRLGEGDDAKAVDFYVLDDPANPLALRYTNGDDKLEVTRIDFPDPNEDRIIERELANDRRTALYGIFFDFNSATIRPRSEPVLREIVVVMSRHPDWALKIEGHTDDIGGAAKNLTLSSQRAAAVRQALIERGVAENRLTTAGYGASVPRETNTTLTGRARNRRVELSRQ